ncbi:MAG: hypothetical protein HYR94_10140 [Chloroflexi bacterium]|nr:hypothetical protein [Chloroflexota bacterium]
MMTSISREVDNPRASRTCRGKVEEVYGHLPRLNGAGHDVFIGWHIHKLPTAPPPPPGMPVISEGQLVGYYGQGQLVAIRMPKYGLITVDLEQQRLVGAVTRNCLEAYGAFEDVLMISLAPLYRRRGWFPLHAFAALGPTGKVALITGAMGAGKTTTGLALLSAGWKLLSNDSPLLTLRQDGQVQVLAYPGRLSAFDDSLARFEGLRRFIPEAKAREEKDKPERIDLLAPSGPQKRVFRVEEAFVEPWAAAGTAGGIFFPQVTPGLAHSELVEVSSKEAVLQLVPQAIEGWDKAAIGQTLHLLGKLVEQVPCYQLKLSSHVEQLPVLIAGGIDG